MLLGSLELGGTARFGAALAALALTVLSSTAAHAEDSSNWRFVAGAAMADGGELIGQGDIVTDGTGKITPYELRAGGGPQYRVGAEYRISSMVSVQGTIGYSVSDPTGYNGSFDFTTVPFEAMAFVNITDGLRVGAGVRKARGEIVGKGVVANWQGNGTYTSEGGGVLEVQYLFGQSEGKGSSNRTQFGASLRAVREEFNHLGYTFSGNHYEAGVVLYF